MHTSTTSANLDASSPALEFDHLSAGYHDIPVLRDITLSVRPGEMVAVLGPNGAGKTTLLRCATGLCRPMAGSARLFGRSIAVLPAAERARLAAVIPQDLDMPVPFTVEELVMIGRTVSMSRWRPATMTDRQAVERVMAYADVIDMRHRPCTELSGGEKQRAVTAMALAQEPRFILMDEATSHLDINHKLEIMQIVERMNTEQGVTVLMISHDLNLSAEFCRRIVLLDHGRIAGDGTPAQVLTEDRLRSVYHCDVRVQKNAFNESVTVLPAPRLSPSLSGKGRTVHVIAGGGCGEEVMRRLCLGDYTVTVGVLNQGDSDADIAAALGVKAALEKPFSPVGAEALRVAGEMIEKADAVVVCGVPFGPGNLANLELASQALARGRRVLLMEGVHDRDYTPDRQATAIAKKLVAGGAVEWKHVTDLLARTPAGS